MIPRFEIELESLRKVYPRKTSEQLASVAMAALGRPNPSAEGKAALESLTLSIRQGERVGIIGPNGAGKSTLLQMLAGVTEPTAGRLNISGKVTAVLTLGVGLREDLTGRENIYLDGETQGKERESMNADVEAIVEFADLGKFIDLPLRTYSTGMKTRLAFAMITQLNPEILIIDEALSVGDQAFQAKAEKRIAELCARGAIVLIVSHGMESITQLCNRCLWLDQGRLLMDGPPNEVTRAYLESVKESDEAEHVARFQSFVGAKSWMPGFALTELRAVSAGKGTKRPISGEPLSIYCESKSSANKLAGKFLLRCVRLDGALICENSLIVPASAAGRQLCMKYPKFNLAPGLYRMHLEWQATEGNLFAESSTVLEVIAEGVPAGGRPVLLNVGDVESLKICEDVKCP